MIQGKLLSYTDDLKEVFEVRKKVFVDEMGLSIENEFDELDSQAIHVLVYDQENQANTFNRTAVATGRIIYEGTSCSIGKIAVLKEYRNNKYGDFTVRMLLNRAFTAGINEVSAKIAPENEGFLSKIGFHRIDNLQDLSINDEVNMKISINFVKTSCNK